MGPRLIVKLQERLREHAKAFDGLLSLIPAKVYYGEDTSVSPSMWSPPLAPGRASMVLRTLLTLSQHSGSMATQETDPGAEEGGEKGEA